MLLYLDLWIGVLNALIGRHVRIAHAPERQTACGNAQERSAYG